MELRRHEASITIMANDYLGVLVKPELGYACGLTSAAYPEPQDVHDYSMTCFFVYDCSIV